MKRKLCALGLALILSLTACGGEKAPTQDGTTSQAPTSAPTAPAKHEKHRDPFSGTYWTAVRWELDAEYKDASDLPIEDRWADLWLNEDGSAQYREVAHCVYNAEMHGGRWQVGEENTLHLTTSDPNAVYPAIDGHLEGEQLVLEYNSQRFYLEQAEPPAPGGELCAADMQGTWLQTGVREDSLAACLHVDEHWVDWGSGYQPTATLYTAEKLDYYVPEYARYEGLELEVLDAPASEELHNRSWCLRLYNEDAEFVASMIDRNTIQLMDESGGIGRFQRVNDLLPDEVNAAMADLPADATIFYWADPSTDLCRRMDFWPWIKLERSCINRILVVSRWVDLQVRIYSGTPQVNAEGRMEQWLIDDLVYETMLGLNEPLWLGMNLPEGTPELCLFFKLPGEEVWRTWPFTKQEPYRVDGHTYFTLN